MRSLLLTLALVSFGAFANPVCDSKAQVKGSFYGNFMGTSHTLQYGFVGYYQGVSDKFDEALKSACTKNLSLQATTGAVKSECVKACDKGAFNFFTGALENTKKNQKLLFNECATLCNVTTQTIHMMGLAAESNNCKLVKAPLHVNDSEGIKDVSEKLQKKQFQSSSSEQ